MINLELFKQEKEQFEAHDLVCFCFQYSRKQIEEDCIANGGSTILARIAAEKQKGACDCGHTNPKGR
ncbi:MAG: hypothetical protein Q4G66_08680 [bacterium]|nr:hypothetical protein [bacterium]